MKDKKKDMKQASVGRADDAPRAADALTADASQLPPLYIATRKGRLTILNALLL